jgi:CRP-like cAMP-binding protein
MRTHPNQHPAAPHAAPRTAPRTAPIRPLPPTPVPSAGPGSQGRAAPRRYRRGETLLHAGDTGDVLRIERGLVKLVVPSFDGRDRVLAVLGAGDVVGIEAALGGGALLADAVALGAVTAVAHDRASFLDDLQRDPERALAAARDVAARLHGAWTDQARAYRPVAERLAAVMVELAQRFGEPGRGGRRVLHCGLNHHAFAALVGAQRGSVSGAMAEFRRTGAAVGARGTYTIDTARLLALAGEAAAVGFAAEEFGDAAPSDAFAYGEPHREPHRGSATYTRSASHTTTSTPAA